VFNKTLYFHSDDPEASYRALPITGVIHASPADAARLVALPEAVDFGGLREDEARTETLTLLPPANSDDPLTLAASSANWCRVELLPSGRVTVATVPPLPRGLLATTLEAACGAQRVAIPVRGAVWTDLLVVPGEVRVPATANVTPVTRHVALRSRSGTPFAITAVHLPTGLTHQASALAGGGWKLAISGTVDVFEAAALWLVVETDHPEGGRAEIPIRGPP